MIYAPAKINWTLDVLKKRADQYHELDTLMQRISLCDEIQLYKSSSSEHSLSCQDKSIPTDLSNTALLAAKLYFETARIKQSVHITLTKHIPSQAGLGGGSSDAAAVLNALNAKYDALDRQAMHALALKIGADVPFFLQEAPFARCKGIGELITPLTARTYFILLVKPNFGISTPALFKSLDLRHVRHPDTDQTISALENYDLSQLNHLMINALQGDAINQHNEIATLLERLKQAGAFASAMTGSGSCCFGVFETLDAAKDAKKSFADCDFCCACKTSV